MRYTPTGRIQDPRVDVRAACVRPQTLGGTGMRNRMLPWGLVTLMVENAEGGGNGGPDWFLLTFTEDGNYFITGVPQEASQ